MFFENFHLLYICFALVQLTSNFFVFRPISMFPDDDNLMLAAYPDEPLVVSTVDGEYLPSVAATRRRQSMCLFAFNAYTLWRRSCS